MISLIRENTNRLFLDDAAVTVTGDTVTVSIVDEAGKVVNDAAGNSLQNLPCTFLTDKYYRDITFAANTPTGYLRAVWNVVKSGLSVSLSPWNNPQDVKLDTSSIQQTSEILPVRVFLDEFLAGEATLDETFLDAIRAFEEHDKDAFRKKVLAAQGDLERDIKTKFFPTALEWNIDYYEDTFKDTFWLQTMPIRPIISVDSYKLVYGGQDVTISNNIASQMVVNKEMGTIEFLPTVLAGNLFVIMAATITAMGATLVGRGEFSRIPLLFRILYTGGLDWMNLEPQKKESIRQAVGTRALINILPKIDPYIRKQSISRSIDGASKSVSSGMNTVIKQYQEQDKEFVKTIQRELGTNLDMGVI